MRHVRTGLWASVGTLCLSLCFGPSLAYSADTAATVAGDIVSVSGNVFLRNDKKGQAERMRKAKPGDPVYAEDVINTASDGRIKVLMKDKSIVDLGPSALFKIDKFNGRKGAADREVEVSMVYGTMRAAITQKLQGNGKFKVRTPSATMGVRGTEFVVKSEVHDMKEVGRMLNNASSALPPASFAAKDDKGANASTQITVLQGQVDVGKRDFNASANAGRMPASAGVVSLTQGTQLSTQGADTAVAPPKTVDQTQLRTISSEAKVADNTFQKAVVIDTNPQNGGTKDSGQLKQIVASVVNLPPPPAIKPSDIGIPGTLGVNQIFNQPPINLQGVQRRLRVVIVKD